MTTFRLEHVVYIPKVLEPGVLYVSEEYGVAAHLCACGCGSKVATPLNPSAWSFSEKEGLPSLWPSIGSWQLACRSHYVIRNGGIVWAGQWTEAQVLAGRAAEQRRREDYYAPVPQVVRDGLWARIRRGVGWLFGG